MTNKQLLKASMVAKGFTNDMMAAELGISRQSFSYKINGKRPFTHNEISKMAHVLAMTPDQMMLIFFAEDVGE